jgi:hypothetical protein
MRVNWNQVIETSDALDCRSWIKMLRDTSRPMNLTRYGRACLIRQFRNQLEKINVASIELAPHAQ